MPPNQPTQNPDTLSQTPQISSKKSKIWLVIPIILVIFIAGFIGLKLSVGIPGQITKSNFSINLLNPSLSAVIIYYSGTLKGIKDTPQGKQLITDITTDNIPALILSRD